MLPAEPLQAERLADLLVRRRDEDEVARRPEALASQRRERDGARGHLVLHVEGAAAPDLFADELARPGIPFPLRGVGDDRVGVTEERQARPVAARQARDEIRALGRARIELGLDAVRREVVAQHLGCERLVPRRVDGVQAEEPLQELDRLVAERDRRHQACCCADCCCDSAVRSLRERQSSGKNVWWISRPSTSTGVPCVPTTESPITRATTL